VEMRKHVFLLEIRYIRVMQFVVFRVLIVLKTKINRSIQDK
jgi:hypothetical protein